MQKKKEELVSWCQDKELTAFISWLDKYASDNWLEAITDANRVENEGLWNTNNFTENQIRNIVIKNAGGKKLRLSQFLLKVCLGLEAKGRDLIDKLY